MDLPALQYAKTEDGVSIAYVSLGTGSPIVFASNIFGNAHLYQSAHSKGSQLGPRSGEKRTSSTGPVADRLVALGWKVVLHDLRGMGSSDRGVDDFGLEARVKDLEAVVARLGLKQFVLAGFDYGAATAIAYAAKHPDAVTHLILRTPWLSGSRKAQLPEVRLTTSAESMHWTSLAQSGQREWEVFTRLMASVMTGFDDTEASRSLSEAMQRSTTPRNLAAFFEASDQIDVSSMLARLEMPALVVHEEDFPFGSFELSREVAAGLAGSQFVVVSRNSAEENFTDLAGAINQFLRGGTEAPTATVRSPAVLTSREVEVLRLIADGRTNREIAVELVLSVRTVARHVTNIYGKIDARGKADATAYAIRHGIT